MKKCNGQSVNRRHYPKKPKRLPKPLSADVEKRIFSQLPDDWFGVMHRLALVTGLRVHEMLNCRRGAIDLDAMTIRVVGMSNKARIVYFGEAFKCILINYIEQHPAEKGCDLLFQHKGRGYSLIHFGRKIRTFCKMLGIKYTFRQLRNAFAINQIEAGAGMKIEALQKIMGRDSIETFTKYVKYVKSNKRKKQKRTVK